MVKSKIVCCNCLAPHGQDVTRWKRGPKKWALDTDLATEWPVHWGPVEIVQVNRNRLCQVCAEDGRREKAKK